MGAQREVDRIGPSVIKVIGELNRISSEATCKSCAFFEAPVRGGKRHCSLNMKPAPGGDDWCEEYEPRMRKTRAGQKQLPGLMKQA